MHTSISATDECRLDMVDEEEKL